jgi:hypothetical protein
MNRGVLFVLIFVAATASMAKAQLPLYVHPEDRAAGTRRDTAVRIGRVLLTELWPATVTQVRVDGARGHEIAGITLSGTKFHRAIDKQGFLDEVRALIAGTFAHSEVEEVDLWATVPIPVPKGAIVSGDYAVPTRRTVFSCTVRRKDLRRLNEVLHGGAVYWAPDFAARLSRTKGCFPVTCRKEFSVVS